MQIAHAAVGEGPTYVSFDIDCLDPAFAPGYTAPNAATMIWELLCVMADAIATGRPDQQPRVRK